MSSIYLDYAAATPIDSQVLVAMQPYFSRQFYNPSEIYLAARAVRRDLENARAIVARCLGTKPAEIIFTAGATEANNLAIQGIMRRFPDGEALVSAIEHESVLAPAKLFKHRLIPVTKEGIVELDKLTKMITPKTVLVSVMLVNNELGTIQPLSQIAQILNKLSISRNSKTPIYLHTDAAQAPNYLDLSTARLGVDLLSLNSGKIYGPKQSGILFVKAGLKLEPLILGGGQEFNLRSGTENVAGAIGLAKALELAGRRRPAEAKRVTKLRQLFIDELGQRLPAMRVNGSSKHQAPHLLSLTFPGYDNERLMMELDERGIQVAVGSACATSSAKPSHVLAAIGLSDQLAQATLRISLGRSTTIADIKKTATALSQLVNK
ncbi:cysteine desulfurase [Candidatus Saccharibacteria bacterium]|nr:cysteine desulfurase [Candidatus Saccharibacteria bacterium]